MLKKTAYALMSSFAASLDYDSASGTDWSSSDFAGMPVNTVGGKQ